MRCVLHVVLLLGIAAAGPSLVWHEEAADGDVIDSRRAGQPVNPASVVKLATSLWALERLGAEHRFETVFAIDGVLAANSGEIDGDLVVIGGGDPDFHVENAYLVAELLNRVGVRSVRGRLLVDERFWIGWEGGSERTARRPDERATRMASRLRDALDPARWDARTRRIVGAFRARRKLTDAPPAVVVRGGVGRSGATASARPLVAHRSNPLGRLLKRFNAYSNNDIERLESSLGSAAQLAAWLAARWGTDPAAVRFETLSGLGSNRMTPRDVVRLLRDLRATAEQRGLDLRDLLPTAGCDPGTLERFTRLGDAADRALAAKTGTLVRTDGGVAVLAGIAHTESGERLWCVAAPGVGRGLERARRAEEDWVLAMLSRAGGARAVDCGDPVGFSDDAARVRALRGSKPATSELGQRGG